MISIHALREESDIILFLAAILQTQISIHALREESDTINGQQYSKKDISIHALREESDYEVIFVQLLQVLLISIHALREESDRRVTEPVTIWVLFQSTLSVRRATLHPCDFRQMT